MRAGEVDDPTGSHSPLVPPTASPSPSDPTHAYPSPSAPSAPEAPPLSLSVGLAARIRLGRDHLLAKACVVSSLDPSSAGAFLPSSLHTPVAHLPTRSFVLDRASQFSS